MIFWYVLRVNFFFNFSALNYVKLLLIFLNLDTLVLAVTPLSLLAKLMMIQVLSCCGPNRWHWRTGFGPRTVFFEYKEEMMMVTTYEYHCQISSNNYFMSILLTCFSSYGLLFGCYLTDRHIQQKKKLIYEYYSFHRVPLYS